MNIHSQEIARRHSRPTFLFSLLIMMVLMISGAGSLLAQTTHTLTIYGGLGTVGQIDNYTEASRDSGATWQPAFLTGGHPWGFIAGTNSWINFDPDDEVGLNSTTLYRIRFNVPAGYSNPQMTFIVNPDNESDIHLNGVFIKHVVGGGPPYGVHTINSSLQVGLNEITLSLLDYGGLVGLNYRIDIKMTSPQPPTLIPSQFDPSPCPSGFALNGSVPNFCQEDSQPINLSVTGTNLSSATVNWYRIAAPPINTTTLIGTGLSLTTTLAGLAPNNYAIEARISAGPSCQGANISRTFTVFPSPTVTINGPTVVFQNESATLVANVPSGLPPYTFNWNTGATTSSISANTSTLGTSTYTVTVTDAHGCNATATAPLLVKPVQAPPFTYPVTAGHICLPPFMVQDPSKTHYWWAKAAGSGNLEIEFSAVGVNLLETGTATVKVYNPSNALVVAHTVSHPASGETPAPLIVIGGPAAGSLYRIEVSVAAPPPSGQGARHYRLELDGAEQLGTNSPLQAQAENESIRWGVNVLPGEPLNVIVQGGPEAPATMGNFEVRNPSGGLVTTSPLGTPVNIPSPVTGMWTVTVTGLDHHVIATKTSGADRGLYLGAFSDVLPPQIFVPGSISLTTGPNATTCGLAISDGQLGSATAKDNCEVHITRTGVPPNNFFPIGKTPITYTATDGAGNQATATQIVEVIDNTLPTITCPDNKFVTIPSGDAGAVVNWDSPAANDNCRVTVTCSPASGSTFGPGTTTVTCTATDPSGNTATCSFTVTVNRAPNCTATPSISQLWPPNHKMVNITIEGVTDPDGDPVTVTITGITQDEPLNTLGDGNTEPDGAIIGTSIAQVRAERSGTPRVPGNGRVYRISYTASDGRGGTCDGSVAVCVPHDQGNRSVCIDDGQRYNSITGASISVPSASTARDAGEVTAENTPAYVPNSYELLNAYPNPFNPSTTIQYDVPEETYVRLTVFDVLGREVARLVDGQRNEGRYSVTFDASGLKSGMYFYRLETPAFRQTKRFILLK